MRIRIIITFLLFPAILFAQKQNSLSLQEVYEQVEKNYPLAEKKNIQQEIKALNDQVARSGLFPEIQLNADASYQSEVTEFPVSMSGISIPELSKDHYTVSVDVSQSLYDGGLTSARRELEASESTAEDAGVEVSMWQIRSQAEQVFFWILTLQKQQASVAILTEDLEDQLASIQAKIQHGVMLPGTAKVLEAELLKVRQSHLQIRYDIKAAFSVLGELTGRTIAPQTSLAIPEVEENVMEPDIARPELELFNARVNNLDMRQELTETDLRPKVSAFAKGAYGRPGFNVFDDDLHPYWMVGLKAQWSFRNWNNVRKKTEVLQLQKKKVRLEEDAFIIGVRSELATVSQKIEQLMEQIELDEQVLKLREEVVAEKKDQLEQGVITATEYVTELHKEAQARLDLEVRKLKLTQQRIEYLTKKGISWN